MYTWRASCPRRAERGSGGDSRQPKRAPPLRRAAPEEWRWVDLESHDRAAPAARRAARLTVLEGQANETEIPLSKARINIGRAVDVYRAEGLLRRNDLAFTEDTEINRTVSREHAPIISDRASGEY